MGIARVDTFVAICDTCRREEKFTTRNNTLLESRTYGKLPGGWGYVTIPAAYPPGYTGAKDWPGNDLLLCLSCLTQHKGVSV